MFEVYYKDDDLVMGIEWTDDLPFIHHHIYEWKLSTHKKMKEVFAAIVKDLQDKEHTELWSYYKKSSEHVNKFCNYYGFTRVSETETEYIVVKEI